MIHAKNNIAVHAERGCVLHVETEQMTMKLFVMNITTTTTTTTTTALVVMIVSCEN
jgi:hypothetical protein